MDAARYFEEMHLSMSSQKPEYRLVLSVKVQDLGGADAYLELRQEPVSGKARVFYSTMGRQKLNFQLVRKGWQSCHNASGELTGRFPATADVLLAQTDFSVFVRDDALQSCPEAMQLAAAWQAALFTPLPQTAQRPQPVQSRPVRRAPVVENKRWQSILAVLATV